MGLARRMSWADIRFMAVIITTGHPEEVEAAPTTPEPHRSLLAHITDHWELFPAQIINSMGTEAEEEIVTMVDTTTISTRCSQTPDKVAAVTILQGTP